MSKIKMRCITCGKWFQSANAKDVTCPECVQKAKKDKLASKAAPSAAQKLAGQGTPGTGGQVHPSTLPPRPKPATSSGHWFDSVSDVKISEPDPPSRPKLPPSPARESYGGTSYRAPGGYRNERAPGGYRGPGGYRAERPGNPSSYRGPGAYHNAPLSGSIGQRPRQAGAGGPQTREPRPGGPRTSAYRTGGPRGGKPMGKPRTPPAPRPRREKIPPPEPFKPTPEQIAQVEARYLELAAPGEFDGIRTQIAQELTIPKKAVKHIIKELREREHIPSWWESQTYKGDSEEKEKIKLAYEPYLPVPPVGVHRKLADELDLKPGLVYQAIKAIRIDLNLPQYNDPTFHEEEFAEIQRKVREAKAAREAAKAALAASNAASTENASVQVLSAEGESSAEAQSTSASDAVPAVEAPNTLAQTAEGESEKDVEQA